MEIVESQGGIAPDPRCAFAAVAEDEGRIVGCLFFMAVWHMEPLWLESPRVNFSRLVDVLRENLTQFQGMRYYVAAPVDNPVIGGMASHVGMSDTGCRLWSAEV
jgi:hypothetical protein